MVAVGHRDGWVEVGGVPTRVQTWGGWVEDPLPPGDSLIVFITGNPGLTSFYSSFLSALHQQLDVPIWITCQAGHERPPRSSRMRCPRDPTLYNTAGQATHKLAFVKQYVPGNRKLILIGHSLGAKLVSDLLRDKQIAEHTTRCYLLMPTLERIAETPNGKFLTGLLTYAMSIILFFSWVFSLFPERLRVFLISCWFMLSQQHSVDDGCMSAVCELTRPGILRNVFTLALDEMRYIQQLDMQVLNAHWAKLRVYFAQTDGWAPLSFLDSLKKARPDIHTTVLDAHFRHSFVLDNPVEMADILVEDIKKSRAT